MSARARILSAAALGLLLFAPAASWAQASTAKQSVDKAQATADAVEARNAAAERAAMSAEPVDDGTRAATPADQMATRVRSIRRNEYFYQSYGRRDLFSALVTGEFEPTQSAEIVDVNTGKLVGVMWGPTDKFALVEDGNGNGFILRVGDRVANGRVVAIQQDSLVASISLYGITSKVILRLEDRKGK